MKMHAPPPQWDSVLVVLGIEKHIGRAEREILAPVAYKSIFLTSLRTWLSRQLRIARIALLALVAPYRAKHGTSTGFPAPITGK
jgi:hypothetical protein